MVSRRRLVAALGTAAATGLGGCADRGSPTPRALAYGVPAFADGTIPRRHACDGEGISPRVEVERVPPPTESLAVVFTYPDDVASQQALWTVWDIPADTTEIPAGVPRGRTVPSLDGAVQGENERGEVGYLPVCPPPGDAHDHWFTLYALGRPLGLDAGASLDAVREQLETATVASARVTARYRRSA